MTLHHPDSPELAFLYGTIVTDGNDKFSDRPTANVCVFADREVGIVRRQGGRDCSPTGRWGLFADREVGIVRRQGGRDCLPSNAISISLGTFSHDAITARNIFVHIPGTHSHS